MSAIKTATSALTAVALVTGIGLAWAQTEDQTQPTDPMAAATATPTSEQTPADTTAVPVDNAAVPPADTAATPPVDTTSQQMATDRMTAPAANTQAAEGRTAQDSTLINSANSNDPAYINRNNTVDNSGAATTTAPSNNGAYNNSAYNNGMEPAPRADRN